MTDHRPDSPDLLQQPDPLRAGVRRLNRVPFMIALLILALVTGAIFYTYWQRLQQANAAKDRSDSKIGVLANAPTGASSSPRRQRPFQRWPPPLRLLRLFPSFQRSIPISMSGKSSCSAWRGCARRASN